MSDTAIRVEGLGKKYYLSHEAGSSYTALRDVIRDRAMGLFSSSKKTKEEFWALRDISFEVSKGEAVGIIGRNGAGKSTLLKLLSRITEPSAGRAEINGRVSSLLEVGTGFHPELTGRENIFLNGAILGMRRQEIRAKFDEIVAFSGVEKFLDTPVKRFSTGMYLRLAFAVAAHLEPEVLIVDEVLAVGDAAFQQKCLGKMDEVSRKQGSTVLLVSHNMHFISSLCSQAIWLDGGSIHDSGKAGEVISRYIAGVTGRSASMTWPGEKRPGNEFVRLNGVAVTDRAGNTRSNFSSDEQIGLKMTYEVIQPGRTLWLGYNLSNQYGVEVFDTHSVSTPLYRQPHEKGCYIATSWIPARLLNTGSYLVGAAIFNHQEQLIHCHEREVVSFHVYDDPAVATARGLSAEELPGAVRPWLDWTIEKQAV